MAGTFTCSEDEDFGSLGDNKVIVTGGTSGTPADFASFVTADRAGEAVLLAATAGLSPTLALTYALRPVDVIALLISFIVASKTTETDYIFVTGTDWRGAAQTESLDVSAGNGTYVTTKYFATITNIDCSDNSAGGGTQWADGTVRATQPQWGLIWDYGNSQYRVDSIWIDFGDASTSGYFNSQQEQVVFSAGQFLATANNTVKIGDVHDVYGINGSMWTITPSADNVTILTGNAPMLVYASILYNASTNKRLQVGGTITAKNSIFQAKRYDAGGTWQSRFQFTSSSTVNFESVYFNNVEGLILQSGPTLEDVWIERSQEAVQSFAASFSAANIKITNFVQSDILQAFGTPHAVTLIDLKQSLTTPRITSAGGIINEEYTCNIHVTDRDGNALQSVVVDCEDKDTTAVWAVGTITTDANGDIAEQQIRYKKWVGTAETLTTFSPHKFTLSLAGYETLILEAVTVDAPIVWHLELQSQKAPPRAWRH